MYSNVRLWIYSYCIAGNICRIYICSFRRNCSIVSHHGHKQIKIAVSFGRCCIVSELEHHMEPADIAWLIARLPHYV